MVFTRREAADIAAIYGNMPRLGPALSGDHLALAVKRRSAARRIGAQPEDVRANPYPRA